MEQMGDYQLPKNDQLLRVLCKIIILIISPVPTILEATPQLTPGCYSVSPHHLTIMKHIAHNCFVLLNYLHLTLSMSKYLPTFFILIFY
jgi:hypothetical protein